MENFINGLYSVSSGLSIFVTLVIVKQRWARTYHTLITYLLLPLVAYVITNVISNNLALSLGMIGALSIIRFRNPVKNPVELVMYFSLLTMGISFAVNIKWGFFLLVFVVGVLIAAKFFEIFFKKFGLFNFSLSFNDENLTNIIEVESNSEIEFLTTSDSLIMTSFSDVDEKTYFYKLAIKDRKDLNILNSKLKSLNGIKNLEIRYFENHI
tara:strand:+ start:628 stop:1260 length:633 start_codon:yes stop_codon:yes gene_type:complete